ncbi:MAG: restriction endonuclease subunit S [Anaerolineae bacterium]|nr:restriction endonuclease subunit S [Anaerolineae bacterium]MCO5198596.1 restriction endonuclease subunit S [Anaerolineae bacterium]
MQPYPAYKESGVEWIEKIPSHWTTTQVKRALEFLDHMRIPLSAEVRGTMTNKTYDYYGASGIIDKVDDYLFDESLILLGEDGANLINRSSPLAFLAHGKFWVNNHAHILRPRSGSLGYFVNLLESIDYVPYVSGSAQPKLTREALGAVRVVVPPREEQHSIAAFLDEKTEAIDALIAKKRRQIALLQEQRAALINQAVTKGLDRNRPMKDSGVPWIGEIPAEWTVAPVYSKYLVQLGKMLDKKRITGKHLGPYLRNVDVQWDSINVDNLPKMDFHPDEWERYGLKVGDLLVCEGGEVGRAAIWNGSLEPCYYQKALHRLRPINDHDHSRFMFYLLRMAANRGLFVSTGNLTTIDHLTGEKLRQHRFPFAPSAEQERIACYLDQETDRIDTAIQSIEGLINLLSEYRTALISAAVTGKIDVRDVGV